MNATAKVYLVGAGPGDPMLVTRKAEQLIRMADVILYDYLIHPNILLWAKQKAKKISVGKKKNAHSKQQSQINQSLKRFAAQGKMVVRLKGGDPVVFGRGGEEMAFLEKRGIPYEVVPGVSSAVAAPVYAGIPLTRRDLSRSIAFVTGTGYRGKGPDDIQLPEADTVIVLMGMTHLAVLVQKFLANPTWGPHTPAAIVQNGSLADQKTVVGTLSSIESLKKSHHLTSPAVLIVGEVAALAKTQEWRQKMPLFGAKIWVLRSPEASHDWVTELELLGAEAVQAPMISVVPIRKNGRKIGRRLVRAHQWILFTSSNAVNYFFESLEKKGLDTRVLANRRIGAVGPKTAARLKSYGIIADVVPETFTASGLFESVGSQIEGKKILIPTAERAKPWLADQLRSKGADVTWLPLYETRLTPDPTLSIQSGDYVVFTSSSTAAGFFESPKTAALTIVPFSMGPQTTRSIQDYTKLEVIQPNQSDWPSLRESILAYHKGTQH